jgi:hypothetical protein
MNAIALVTGANRGVGLATARELGAMGVTTLMVTSVCPGFVQTDIHPPSNRFNATTTPDEAGEFIARIATDPGVETGTFIDRNGTVPW